MALLFMDSFDHYATSDITNKWTQFYTAGGAANPAITAAVGRHSSAGLQSVLASGGDVRATGKAIASSGATCVVGFSFHQSVGAYSVIQIGTALDPLTSRAGGGSAFLVAIRQGPANQITLRTNTNGTLGVYRGTTGTLLANTTNALNPAQVYYIELKVLIDPTVGTVEVRVNEAVWLSLTGQNTRATAVSGWDEIVLGHLITIGSAATWIFDDVYLLDGSGAAPWNTFLGDCRVDVRFPTGAGATSAWTPSAGANWQCVDDATPNFDTDYTEAATAGLVDTFAVQDAPVAGATLYGVQHCLHAKKTDAGAASIAAVVRHSGVDYVGGNLNPSNGTYNSALAISALNPGTAAAWTESGFNAAEFGYKRTI